MNPNTLEYYLSCGDHENLVRVRDPAYYRGSKWGCCGARIGLSRYHLPVGVEAFISTRPFEKVEYQETKNPRYQISTDAVEIGAGNYLNLKMVHHDSEAVSPIDADAIGLLCHIPKEAPAIEDGPPHYTAYWGNLAMLFKNNAYRDMPTNWDNDGGPKKLDKEEFYRLCNGRLKGCTMSYILREDSAMNQRKDFEDHFLNPLGWKDKIIYESPLFNNRNHNRETDYLRLIVLKFWE